MRTLRAMILIVSVLAALLAQAEKIEFTYTALGAKIGTSTLERQAEGTFRSVTEIKVANVEVRSELQGRLVEGTLTEFTLDQTVQGTRAVISAKDGKAKIVAGGQEREVSYAPTRVFFSNYHPFTTGTVADAFNPSVASSQKVDTFVIDALTAIPIEVVAKLSQRIEIGGMPLVAKVHNLKFPTVAFDVFTVEGEGVVAWDIPTQRTTIVRLGFEKLVEDPTLKYPELSKPEFAVKIESNVRVPMRDGVELAAEVIRPAQEGDYPVILVRTPYGRKPSAIEGEWWARRGYVFVSQDVRGRGESAGEWTPFVHERDDGFDTIGWIEKQPWCSGRVGMIGGSYVGWVQWWAAVERPAALKCIVPQVSPPDPFFNFPIDHGVPMLLGAIWWLRVVEKPSPDSSIFTPFSKPEALLSLPLSSIDDELLGKNIPFFDDWLSKESSKAFGRVNFHPDLPKVDIPALHISGWWDGDGIGTRLNWMAMNRHKKRNQHLIYGPWTHAFNTTTSIGDVDYGPEAILELQSVYLRWFDHWLKERDVWKGQPTARVFVTGANEWRELAGWPDPSSELTTLYFRSVGGLSTIKPGSEEPDRFTYDPAKIAFEPKDLEINPADATTVLNIKRTDDDFLLYSTGPLKEPMIVAGPIEVELHFATSARDTDFFATLIDKDPDGIRRLIAVPGKIRARYHRGFDRPELLTPGRTYKVTFPIWDTAHEVEAGHSLEVLISSQSFPSFARNLNTGEPAATGTRMVAAHQTLYHDRNRPSAIRFYGLPPKTP